ncbi:hypothetical protein EDC01DRAFT_678265 [Geopyxis carbonaria]|nr:hypothetical protein EDC01DRAFT_678265 [Geopyxis carbonaria]
MSLTALRPLLRTPLAPTFTPLRAPTLTLSRNANLIPRPKRPYLLDQIIILSDGSSYKQLTTSPRGVIRSTKDVRNNPMWNPSMRELADVEEDEAGKLRRFRQRFGTGFEVENEDGDENSLGDLFNLATPPADGKKK